MVSNCTYVTLTWSHSCVWCHEWIFSGGLEMALCCVGVFACHNLHVCMHVPLHLHTYICIHIHICMIHVWHVDGRCLHPMLAWVLACTTGKSIPISLLVYTYCSWISPSPPSPSHAVPSLVFRTIAIIAREVNSVFLSTPPPFHPFSRPSPHHPSQIRALPPFLPVIFLHLTLPNLLDRASISSHPSPAVHCCESLPKVCSFLWRHAKLEPAVPGSFIRSLALWLPCSLALSFLAVSLTVLLSSFLAVSLAHFLAILFCPIYCAPKRRISGEHKKGLASVYIVHAYTHTYVYNKYNIYIHTFVWRCVCVCIHE